MSNTKLLLLSSLTITFFLSLTILTSHASPTPQTGALNMELWCVAKNNAEDSTLQAALDWACGQGGADCRPIQPNGPCYDTSDVQKMASYAFNDYYLKHGLADDACSFDNNAALTSLNPSRSSCKYPSSASLHKGSFTGSSTVGTGPTFSDMNGCHRMLGRWFWYVVVQLVLVRGFFIDFEF